MKLPTGGTVGKADTGDNVFATEEIIPHDNVIERHELADWRRILRALSPALLARWVLETGHVDPLRNRRHWLFGQMVQLELRRRRQRGTL